MAILGMTFGQAAASFGWGELVNFSNHLPPGSATLRALRPDEARFAGDLQRNAILADVFDALGALIFMFSKKGSKRPSPYPRPWSDRGAQKIGSNPIPVTDFDSWYNGGDQWPKA